MSTLSSLVLASSSTLTLDLIKDNLVRDLDEKATGADYARAHRRLHRHLCRYRHRSVRKPRHVHRAADGPFVGRARRRLPRAVLYGLYWKRATKAAVWTSFVFGVGIMLLNLFFRSSFPPVLQSPINCGAFAMLAGLVIVPVVSLFTPGPDKTLVDEAFARYDQVITTHIKSHLND
jgi:Na+/proline symporter